MASWTAAYTYTIYESVNRLDFTDYFRWLVAAWTFHGGEMVGFTWLASIVVFIPLAVISVFVIKRKRL